jgi:hypothetical protein
VIGQALDVARAVDIVQIDHYSCFVAVRRRGIIGRNDAGRSSF